MADEVADFTHCPKCGVYTVGPCTCDAAPAEEVKPKRKAKKADPAPVVEAPVEPAPEAPAPEAPAAETPTE
jgi:hypothetical protein